MADGKPGFTKLENKTPLENPQCGEWYESGSPPSKTNVVTLCIAKGETLPAANGNSGTGETGSPKVLRFKTMQDCPRVEGVPFLILRHGNDAADFLIQQVQWFEGEMYPDALEFAVDYSDRIADAVGWLEIEGVQAPQTVDATLV